MIFLWLLVLVLMVFVGGTLLAIGLVLWAIWTLVKLVQTLIQGPPDPPPDLSQYPEWSGSEELRQR